MSKPLIVADLKAALEALPNDLPVFVYDLQTCETFPLELVDPTISDRVDLNFSSKEIRS